MRKSSSENHIICTGLLNARHSCFFTPEPEMQGFPIPEGPCKAEAPLQLAAIPSHRLELQ